LRIARTTFLASVRFPVTLLVVSALCGVPVAARAQPAGATLLASRTSRAGVPLERSTRKTLPTDTVDVRIAMTENDTSKLVVASPSGDLVATGTTGATAVTYTPNGNGTWAVATGTGCTGPWTKAVGESVSTPVVRSSTSGVLLTLCADNGTQLPIQGTLEGVYNSAGDPRTVNTLPLEEYVADVVPGESISDWGTVGTPGPQGRPWGFQELEAQAVAIRSYVLASPGGYGGYATTCDLYCQSYRGAKYLTANSTAAAQDTAGEVMVMPSGSIASTEYSSSTGGYTSSGAEGSPFVPEPDTGDGVCLTPNNPGLCNPNHDWTKVVALSTIHANWPNEGTSPTVTVSARNGYGTWGGRATEVTIFGNGGSQTVASFTFVSTLELRSNYFTIAEMAGRSLVITGHGWGHGIGMGQWGAFGYAVGTDGGQGNWTWQRIVEHYYAPATIQTLPGTGTATFSDSRVDGPTADGTAAQELEHQFTAASGRCPGSGSTRPVVLATDAGYSDALASAPLARGLGTGTLLTPAAQLSATTASAIHLEGVTRVYVVGGPLAVSTSVVTTLQSMPASACGGGRSTGADIRVTRLDGQTVYDTAAQIAADAAALDGVGALDLAGAYEGSNRTGGPGRYNTTAGTASSVPVSSGPIATAIVATGKGFQDAEAASVFAYAERLPILLTTSAELSTQASFEIRALGIRQVVVMGGQLAVSDGVVASLEQLGVSVLRVAGTDATGTSVELAELETASSPAGAGWHGTDDLAVARGNGYSDGLAGAVVAADGPGSRAPQPLVLTETPSSVGTALTAFLETAGTTGLGGARVDHLTVLGGPLAVTQSAVDQMVRDLSS
jgi:SpoIID/LytB domain protein